MRQKLKLSLEDAKRVVEAAEAHAVENGLAVAVVVVDDSTCVQSGVRMDGAGPMTFEAALAKARSTAGSGFPTSHWAQVLRGGETGVLAIPGVNPVPGGVPIVVEGQCVGAVGVSGALPHLDVAVAQAGAAAVASSSAAAPAPAQGTSR